MKSFTKPTILCLDKPKGYSREVCTYVFERLFVTGRKPLLPYIIHSARTVCLRVYGKLSGGQPSLPPPPLFSEVYPFIYIRGCLSRVLTCQLHPHQAAIVPDQLANAVPKQGDGVTQQLQNAMEHMRTL